MWTVTITFLQMLLNGLAQYQASGSFTGSLASVYLGLGIAPTPSPTPQMVMSNITEANYNGYARQLVSWYPPFIEASGPFLLEGRSMVFTPTNDVVPNVITFCFLATALTGGTYLMGCLAPNGPVNLAGPLNTLVADAEFSLPFSAVYGGPDVSN